MLPKSQGVASLANGELSKLLSQNVCNAEIMLFVGVSSWNFVHTDNDSVFTIYVITGIVYFRELILESSET